tara:strand:- start:5198 stop:6067 length:870 start_codon:yes stop_codon:yes gene_type:complete
LKNFSSKNNKVKVNQLKKDGFCILENVADKSLLDKTRKCVKQAISDIDDVHLERQRSVGTLISSGGYPELADLIGNPRPLEFLNKMGYHNNKYWKAVIISKPPGSPRLYWHQDCMMWKDPSAYSEISPMLFLMYYLEDTNRINGCLRVIPGSHRKRHELHGMGSAHQKEINSYANPNDLRFSDYPDEIDIPIKPGDLVIGDGRMFHAAHSNDSERWRTVITIWILPFFDNLLEPVRSWFNHDYHVIHDNWPNTALNKIKPLIPNYNGNVEPTDMIQDIEIHRTPDNRLN